MTEKHDAALDLYVKAVLGKKALNVVVLDVAELTSFADVFIICSGRSNRQVSAIADFIKTDLKKHNIKPLSDRCQTNDDAGFKKSAARS